MDDYDFELLDSVEKSPCVLGKHENINYYDCASGPGQQLHSQSSLGEMAVVEGQRNGKLCHSCVRVMKEKLYEPWVSDHVVHLGLNVSRSVHNCRHMTMAVYIT